MKNHKIYMLLLGSLLILSMGCEKWTEKEIYKRPDWLPGKLYTTVSVQENLTLFTECLRITGLDSILDVSGSWSVFAPTDEAIKLYLAENNYTSISSIPIDELEKITKFHVIQNPWSLEQLQSLSIYGWRTVEDENLNSYAYKRQTILKNSNEKYWIRKGKEKDMIVLDSTKADTYKRIYIDSRKYVPIFYDAYLNVNGISSNDYSYYFNRPYEPGNVYYAGAMILKSDIFAENGFVHIIDRVVNPMLNAQELLERTMPGESYKLFLEMIYWYYPSFSPNITATNSQYSVRKGGVVDTLWELNYNDLPFALQRENTGYIGADANETLVRHNSLFAPTDDAFREFLDGILTAKSGFPHWSDFKSLPSDIAEIIVAQNFKPYPIYPSTGQYRKIFREKGRYHQNEEDIIRKEFGSNSTFIGLSSYIPDRVFTSVTSPVFCRPSYSIFRRALLYSGTYNAIANHKGELYFFPIPDYALMTDSSMLVNWINRDENRYNFMTFNRNSRKMENLGSRTISTWILNQVGTSVQIGSDNKEIIRTLGGKYITWDHSNNTIQGTLPSTIGYKGNETAICTPVLLDEPTENGKSWTVGHWFNFGN